MGLSSALSAAASGLRITQEAVDVAAKNVANVDSPGFTKKSLVQEAVIAGDRTVGVRVGGYTREVNTLVQRELRRELGGLGGADVMADFYDRLDRMFGAPGSSNALDTVYNNFSTSLSNLVTTPESLVAQAEVVSDAQVVTQRVNNIADGIQNMRQEAEQQIGEIIDRVNVLLGQLEASNDRIISQTRTGNPPVDLLDQRDVIIDELSRYMDMNIIARPDGGVNILTSNGTLLFDYDAVRVVFDERFTINAEARWDRDASVRGVGSISIVTPAGYEVDLIADNGIRGGMIGGLLDLRDTLLVEAQQQLDEFAGALSRTFSDNTIASAAATVGLQTGFEVDTSPLLAGDPITLTYTDNTTGEEEVVTFIRVDEPSVLPLSDDATPRVGDTVHGIDFSAGFASAAADIQTALGANFTISDEGAGVIRFLDDGAPDLVSITSLEAVVTATTLTDNGLGFPLFIDAGLSPEPYSGNFDGGNQLVGFASRIGVNPDIDANPEFLVIYDSITPTEIGDATRPQAMLDRLEASDKAFSGLTGLGGASGYVSDVAGFMRQVIVFQGAAANNARQAFDSQEQIVNALQETYTRDTGVNVDEEMAKLIELQNAYAANARVISTIDEMIDALMRI